MTATKSSSRPETLTETSASPRIVDVVPEFRAQGLRFIIPVTGVNNMDCFVDPLTGLSIPTKMTVRVLSLPNKHVIPFHRHPLRDKVLLPLGGFATLFQCVNGRIVTRFLDHDYRQAFIEAGTWHAILTAGDASKILITLAPVMEDIEWEKGVGMLTENRHLQTA